MPKLRNALRSLMSTPIGRLFAKTIGAPAGRQKKTRTETTGSVNYAMANDARLLQQVLGLPPTTTNAVLTIKAGEPIELTVTRLITYNELNELAECFIDEPAGFLALQESRYFLLDGEEIDLFS